MCADNFYQRTYLMGASPRWRVAALFLLCCFACLVDQAGPSQAALAFLTCCCIFLVRNHLSSSGKQAYVSRSTLISIAWAVATGSATGTIGGALLNNRLSTISSTDGAAIPISALALLLCFALIRRSIGERPGSKPGLQGPLSSRQQQS